MKEHTTVIGSRREYLPPEQGGPLVYCEKCRMPETWSRAAGKWICHNCCRK